MMISIPPVFLVGNPFNLSLPGCPPFGVSFKSFQMGIALLWQSKSPSLVLLKLDTVFCLYSQGLTSFFTLITSLHIKE